MNHIAEYPWNNLQMYLPEEQTFYLLIMTILHEFQRARKGAFSSSSPTQKSFREIFSDIPDYDLKESVFRLSEKVDWSLVENNKELQTASQAVSENIFQIFYNAFRNHSAEDQLDALLESVLETSGAMRGYAATPRVIRQFTEELMDEVLPEKIADFCCGTALFGISFCRKRMENHTNSTLYAAEISPDLCTIGRILMELHGINGQIEQKDILTCPEKAEVPSYDFISLDIPRGKNQGVPYDRSDPRLPEFNKKTIYSDWIFIQDALYHLNDGGYAVILSTAGALSRANEQALREQIVKNDWLEAVITLPVNLYPSTRIGTELLIFHKGKAALRQGKILFIDISQYYFRETRNAYSISVEGQKAAITCFKNYKEMDGISVIKKNTLLNPQTYSFKPIQYIHQDQTDMASEGLALSEIAEIIRGAQILKEDLGNVPQTARFINVKDIQDGVIVYNTAKAISPANPVCKKKYQIYEDDILMTSKGTAMKIAIVEKNPPLAFFSGNITVIRVKKEVYDPYVLFYFLDSEQGRAYLESIQSGTTIRILNNTNLSTLMVPQYPFKKMSEIGVLLKEKREVFLKTQKTLIENYSKEKNNLLNSLKEDL